jgi:N-acetylglucosaminyldiphosphoundecaprenol N-acetyl-beta-D-mannosaminyltransferase
MFLPACSKTSLVKISHYIGIRVESVLKDTDIFGYRISNRGIEGDVALACEFIAAGTEGHFMACANPHSLVVASRDTIFSAALKNADLLIPDGAGILLAAWALRLPIVERVAGSEFFLDLTQQLANRGGARYFFLGSSDQVLDLITRKLTKDFPEITVCGTLSPPFKAEFSSEENADMVAAINAARPDVLWVGMTAPKQEKWIYEHLDKLQVPFCGAIGAVFDFYAGTKVRSSGFWRRFGLEWLPRFLKEPKRLWERNIKSTPIFLQWVAREKVRNMVQS